MIISFIYFFIAYGAMESGWGFWRAISWPVAAGKMLADRSGAGDQP